MRRTSRHGNAIAPLAVGFVASAAIVQALVWLVGRHIWPGKPTLWIVLPAVTLLAALDLTNDRLHLTPMLKRQTPQRWMWVLSPRVTGFFWGLDTGSMVTTFRASASSWAVFVVAFAQDAPWWIGVIYGLAFAIPLWLVVVIQSESGGATTMGVRLRTASTIWLVNRMAKLLPRMRRISGVVLLAVAAWLVAQLLA